FGQLDGRDRDLRGLGFVGDFGHGGAGRRGGGTQQDVDLVFSDQLACIAAGLGGVGGVVEDDVVDFFTLDGIGQQRHGVLFGNAQRGGRTRRGQGYAHVDVGVRRRGSHRHRAGGNGRRERQLFIHVSSCLQLVAFW